MKLTSVLAAAPLDLGASLLPRQYATLCDQYAYWSGSGYEFNNNLWGQGAATSGSQCTYIDGASASGVQWHTTWTWQGTPNRVKSYAYTGRQVRRGRKISSISSMPTTTAWSYASTGDGALRAHVAYDLFTAADPGHVNSSGDFELMIWCAPHPAAVMSCELTQWQAGALRRHAVSRRDASRNFCRPRRLRVGSVDRDEPRHEGV